MAFGLRVAFNFQVLCSQADTKRDPKYERLRTHLNRYLLNNVYHLRIGHFQVKIFFIEWFAIFMRWMKGFRKFACSFLNKRIQYMLQLIWYSSEDVH